MSLEGWFQVAEDAGYDVDRMEPVDVYLLAGKILADLRAMRQDRSDLKKMSAAQKLALRERVSGVIRFKAKVR